MFFIFRDFSGETPCKNIMKFSVKKLVYDKEACFKTLHYCCNANKYNDCHSLNKKSILCKYVSFRNLGFVPLKRGENKLVVFKFTVDRSLE